MDKGSCAWVEENYTICMSTMVHAAPFEYNICDAPFMSTEFKRTHSPWDLVCYNCLVDDLYV